MNTSTFEAAIGPTLKFEGGYVDDPADHGGATNYGVTQAVARAYGYQGDMRSIPMSTVMAIYRTQYWSPTYASFPQEIASKVFDMGVNMGPGRARKFLQQALNSLGCHLVVDGVLGPQSCAAVASADPTKLLAAIRTVQKQFYLNIVAKDPSQTKFLRGWLSRAAY